ncbi:CaiB/BaiF CoA-transferase family protein [Nitratireductor sp. ZSWI3]|uniref:CaiB/BaiF CoA transferase family protein n=1 Tax=Nitratireductor sp. ZSWI3 TaxID=2966359 RepID=UPI00215042DD|nr:CaiB/BaiF CoA-transferase family protein [Nitratireductor sp. ZSWI3]MCR4265160.1 CoA transferase [Nitratireductor sp. ZSWI3]
MTGAFSGLLVVDTTHVLAGPFASYQMALLGAEVIKVEAPDDPDQARFQGSDRDLVRAAMGTSFLAQGAGKKTLALDLKSDRARAALRKLVAKADVFVENYRPGAFEGLGLGYRDLARLNPRLIYCSVSAFGATGPRRQQTGYDNVIQAFSGIMDLTGHGDDRPLKCGAPAVDYATGLTAAFAISAALFQRERNGGKGQYIDVSMLDVATTLLTSHATDFLWSGKHPRAKGNRFAFATLGMYRAADANIMIAASNLRQQRRLWIALGREDLVKTSNLDRIDAFDEEHAALAEIISTMPAAFWEDFLTERRIPAARIRRMEEALSDPQAEARGQFLRLEDPSGRVDGLRVPSVAFRMSATEAGVTLPPQPVGAQTAEILRMLGLGDHEIEALCIAGIARQAKEAEEATP